MNLSLRRNYMACKQKDCTCTYTSCVRHGKCCECVTYHRSKDEVPGCFFTEQGEKTYDRSMSNFINDYTSNR